MRSSDSVSFWIYQIITDDKREEKINSFKKYDIEKAKKYINYDHKLFLIQIDCKKRKIKSNESVEYDDTGNILYHSKNNDNEWDNIIPDSIGETFHQKLCVNQEKFTNSKVRRSKSQLPDFRVWKYYTTDIVGYICFFNKTNISKTSNILSIWSYDILTDSAKKDLIEYIEKNKINMNKTNFSELDHTVKWVEIDCINKKIKRKEIINYDPNNNILNHQKIENDDWSDISPYTSSEDIYKRFCVSQ